MEKVVDFNRANQGYRDYGGSDSKESLVLDGENYMIKYADEKIKLSEIETSESNSIFSEYISSHIAKAIGLPVHDTVLGVYKNEYVVACKDFEPEGYRLQEFEWFMKTVYRKGEIGRIPTLQQVYGTINNSTLVKIKDAAIERYWDTFVFDALVGNFDRHKGNWGYFVNEITQDIQLAPIYDNGSSLYPALSDYGMEVVLSSEEEKIKRIEIFPKSALNKNENIRKVEKYGYYELLSSDIDANCVCSLLKIAPIIDLNKIFEVIEGTPIISNTRKRFYKEMITLRKTNIIDRAFEIQKNKQYANIT